MSEHKLIQVDFFGHHRTPVCACGLHAIAPDLESAEMWFELHEENPSLGQEDLLLYFVECLKYQDSTTS